MYWLLSLIFHVPLPKVEEPTSFSPQADWRMPIPNLGGPDELERRNLTNTYRCRQHLAGRLYPVRDSSMRRIPM
jgi:hypothetical protein